MWVVLPKPWEGASSRDCLKEAIYDLGRTPRLPTSNAWALEHRTTGCDMDYAVTGGEGYSILGKER